MSLVAFLIAKGVPARLAKPLIAFVALIALASLLWAGIAIHDRNVVKTHDAGQVAATAVADRKADATAAVERQDATTRQAQEHTAIKETVDEARRTGADPRAAYYHCVGLQQAARRVGGVVPACH